MAYRLLNLSFRATVYSGERNERSFDASYTFAVPVNFISDREELEKLAQVMLESQLIAGSDAEYDECSLTLSSRVLTKKRDLQKDANTLRYLFAPEFFGEHKNLVDFDAKPDLARVAPALLYMHGEIDDKDALKNAQKHHTRDRAVLAKHYNDDKLKAAETTLKRSHANLLMSKSIEKIMKHEKDIKKAQEKLNKLVAKRAELNGKMKMSQEMMKKIEAKKESSENIAARAIRHAALPPAPTYDSKIREVTQSDQDDLQKILDEKKAEAQKERERKIIEDLDNKRGYNQDKKDKPKP